MDVQRVSGTRRVWTAAVMSFCAVIVAAGCSSSGGSNNAGDESSASSSGVIKIGEIAALSGPNASIGNEAINGATIAVDEWNNNGGVLGKKIQIVKEDSLHTAAGASQAFRTLVGSGVNLMAIGTSTDECTATIPLLTQANAVALTDYCTTDSLTGSGVSSRFFRVNPPSTQVSNGLGNFVCSHFSGVTRIDHIMIDETVMHALLPALDSSVAKCGVKSGTTIFVPDTVAAPLTYVQSLLRQRASDSASHSVLEFEFFGAPLGTLMKEFQQLGVVKDYRALVTDSIFSPEADALKPNVPHVFAESAYSPQAATGTVETNFLSDFQAKFHTQPGDPEANAFNAMEALLNAIKKADSTDPAKVATALSGLTFSDTAGRVTIDPATHQANVPEFVTEYNGASMTTFSTHS